MSITLDAITLPADLLWRDEFDYTPIETKTDYSLTGALIIQSGLKQAGRPMTLGGGDNFGIATRSLVNELLAKQTPPTTMTLTLNDARSFQVRFRYQDKPIEAQPLIDYSDPDNTDFYTLTLKFLQV